MSKTEININAENKNQHNKEHNKYKEKYKPHKNQYNNDIPSPPKHTPYDKRNHE